MSLNLFLVVIENTFDKFFRGKSANNFQKKIVIAGGKYVIKAKQVSAKHYMTRKFQYNQ